VTTSNEQAVAIIPARYGSTRFPGKPLVRETGRYLIQHVCDQARQARRVARVIVATDDERIRDAVAAFGGEAVMTRSDHPNGTSRLAEAAETLADPDAIVVNVQGDEPEIDPSHIDRAIEHLIQSAAEISTLAAPLAAHDDPDEPNLVKVVVDQNARALYFSRSRIPYPRDEDAHAPPVLKHIGLYVYRRAFLLQYVNWPRSPLEKAEQLEQLRVLEHGRSIVVGVVESAHPGIDTPEQYRAFVERWREAQRG